MMACNGQQSAPMRTGTQYMALTRERSGRGPRITLQLDRLHQEFLKAHRRQYGVAASWIIRRLIENQMASGRVRLGKPVARGRPHRTRRPRAPALPPPSAADSAG
jgi:hypothetical protein